MKFSGDEQYEKFSKASIENTIDLKCDIVNFRGKVMNRVEYKSSDGSNMQDSSRAEVIIRNVVINNSTDSILQSKL